MIDIRRILCPIDFSDFSRRALDHAVAMARWYDSTITLLHVCPSVPVAAYGIGETTLPSALLTPDDRAELLASMTRFAGMEGAEAVSLQFEIAEGNVTAEILDLARTRSSDLIVIGTHGRSGFERLALGSVTEKVLRKATCPVLSVPRLVPEAVPASPGLFKEILCAVDFSDCSMRALAYATAVAQEADARLAVLHVIELPTALAFELGEPGNSRLLNIRQYRHAAEEQARKELSTAVPEDVRSYCTVDTILATGKPYQEILRVAGERHSELVVMGIQGRGAMDRLFFGSTTQHVVRQAACPVLTLRMD